MAATAPARSRTAAPARRAPARRAPAKRAPRRRQITPHTGFVPVAVGAVGGIADSGLVVRLTRSRLWIGMLAALLVGIVALNVMALSFSASSSEAGRQADVFKRQNSALRAQIAQLTASQQVQETAGRLGLHIPNPDQVGYLRPRDGDAAAAAKRLRDGELTTAEYVAPVETATTVPTTETAVAPIDPSASTETAPTTATAPTTETAPAAPATTGTAVVSGGGVSSP